jgi:hypothetical protein
MQERTILLRFLAAPLRQRLVAGGIAVVIGSGLFLWSRYGATPPATTAVLLFDAAAARQVDPGVMNAHAKEPAVALAQSILSDQAVRELAKQSGVSFSSDKSEVSQFRSRLVLAQASASLLRVNYKDTDKKRSAMMANAVANSLVAWIPESAVPAATSVPTATSAPSRPGAPSAKRAFAKWRRRRHSLHAQSHELRESEKQLAGVDRKLTALDGYAVAPQQASVAAPPASTDDEPRRTLESQLRAAQKKLDDLRARYTDEYPDVESTKDDIGELRQKLASLLPVRNEAERAASSPKPNADANETDQLRLKRARLMETIQVEKRREAERRVQAPSSMGDSALAMQTVSLSSTRQTPIRQFQNLAAGQIWQPPFRLVRLAGDPGSGQSESGLLWYWPLAAILWGLLYSGVAVWRYRPIERAALLQLPMLNKSRLSRGPAATEPSVELGLFKKLRYCEKTIIEAALTECAGQVSGPSGAAAQLGVPAAMLESKIKSLKIDKSHFKSAYLSTTSN